MNRCQHHDADEPVDLARARTSPIRSLERDAMDDAQVRSSNDPAAVSLATKTGAVESA